ncbi:hypothetical protein DFR30_0602 [Thiogranum longum]|uniref:Uncharacterized protein n=1 Tax=Thiogranum longum TaxID=1537524 RepID=A0A4R1HA49_9GAMM|nr:hypothetical protein [Thiogranum longum]TCK17373.1 hypothetical protein DFR30_0602 [Thiogranum longum]
MKSPITLLLLGLLTVTGLPLYAAKKADVELQFKPRTPDQMSAFYEARGFPDAMIKPLHAQCFITVRVTNTGQDIVWLDLARWTFTANGKPLQRYHRNYWLEKWKDMGMPAANRSTFRWTLLPELLDYQPGESEGGNIILPRVKGPIHLHAEFATGKEGKGPAVKLDFDNLRCVENMS